MNTEIQLAAIITRATAYLLGLVVRQGLTRTSISIEARRVYVWHHTTDYRWGVVIVIGRRSGRVLYGRVLHDDRPRSVPVPELRGAALRDALTELGRRIRRDAWFRSLD